MDNEMEIARLDRVAKVDGYRVRSATSRHQQRAWGGSIGVFREGSLLFAADNPYQVRGWLCQGARTEHSRGAPTSKG